MIKCKMASKPTRLWNQDGKNENHVDKNSKWRSWKPCRQLLRWRRWKSRGQKFNMADECRHSFMMAGTITSHGQVCMCVSRCTCIRMLRYHRECLTFGASCCWHWHSSRSDGSDLSKVPCARKVRNSSRKRVTHSTRPEGSVKRKG